MQHANCRGQDIALFFPERGKSLGQTKDICGPCPVRAQCLAHAINTGENHGIWGGVLESKRRRLRREAGLTIEYGVDKSCGTDSGYAQHYRLGEPPCEPCRQAHSQARRERRAAA